MNEPSVTTSGFVREIIGSIRKHRGEPALVIACLITFSVLYLSVGARLHAVSGDLAHGVVGSLLPFFVAVLLLQFAVAAWRVYRRQQTVITTKQTLHDLSEVDRAESEQKLRAHTKRLEGKVAAPASRLRGER